MRPASRPLLVRRAGGVGMRTVGLILLTLSLALVVAAPLVGQIPLGLAICLVGLGLVERDGLLVVMGLGVGAVGVLLNAGFIYAIVSGLMSLFNL